MYEYIWRDIQLAMDIAAAVTKHRYDSCYCQEEFVEDDEVWISQGVMYRL